MHHKYSKAPQVGNLKKLCFAAVVAGICNISNSSAADWPCFRGPDGLGVSSEKGLPLEWSKEKNVAWSVPLPGKGASAPVIVGNRVYVTTQTEDLGLHVL